MDIYKNLPALARVLAPPTYLVLAAEAFPRQRRRIFVAPLVKQEKDKHQADSRRPAALPRTAVKSHRKSAIPQATAGG